MGFYSPAVLVKDAQRHGLKVKPIDVQTSDWLCTIEHESGESLSLRIGLRYARRLRRQAAEALVQSRILGGSFRSAEDLALRVPSLDRKELALLARIGALNKIDGVQHRRDALWQVERAGKAEGPLLTQQSEWLEDDSRTLPLRQMNMEDRLVADYAGTGMTTGKHPMHYRRPALSSQGILSAGELKYRKDGEFVRTAGCVIARQRPGTAKGFIFISMEDETGIANVIVTPDLYDRDRLLVTRSKFLLVEGKLQNQDSVIHVKALRLHSLSDHALEVRSHDFH
jgi:error-prone DNA polymerase